MYRLLSVSKRYAQAVALEALDLTISPERTTVLIGPSGCGKSTILRLLAGLIWPETGQVFFRAAPLTPAIAPQIQRRIGYVIQEGGLFPHLTARGNIVLMARYLRWSRTAVAQRLEALADLVQLSPDLLDHYPGELSGGQRQRVSLMRALMLDPDVLLLDEPLGALDPMIRFDLQQDLRSIFQRLRKTVVLVTHDLGEAAFLGDTLVLLRAGRIVQQGTLSELVKNPRDPFVERFVRAQRGPLNEMSRP